MLVFVRWGVLIIPDEHGNRALWRLQNFVTHGEKKFQPAELHSELAQVMIDVFVH